MQYLWELATVAIGALALWILMKPQQQSNKEPASTAPAPPVSEVKSEAPVPVSTANTNSSPKSQHLENMSVPSSTGESAELNSPARVVDSDDDDMLVRGSIHQAPTTVATATSSTSSNDVPIHDMMNGMRARIPHNPQSVSLEQALDVLPPRLRSEYERMIATDAIRQSSGVTLPPSSTAYSLFLKPTEARMPVLPSGELSSQISSLLTEKLTEACHASQNVVAEVVQKSGLDVAYAAYLRNVLLKKLERDDNFAVELQRRPSRYPTANRLISQSKASNAVLDEKELEDMAAMLLAEDELLDDAMAELLGGT